MLLAAPPSEVDAELLLSVVAEEESPAEPVWPPVLMLVELSSALLLELELASALLLSASPLEPVSAPAELLESPLDSASESAVLAAVDEAESASAPADELDEPVDDDEEEATGGSVMVSVPST